MFKNGDKIEKDGDTWVIVSLGVEVDGKRYAHLASTTRFRQQRNGKVPVQQGDWIECTTRAEYVPQTYQEAQEAAFHEALP